MTLVLRPDPGASRLVSLACAMVGQHRYAAALVALDRAQLRCADEALRERLRTMRARVARRADAPGDRRRSPVASRR